MQELDRLYLPMIIYLPKKGHIQFKLERQPDCDKLGRIKLQFHIVNNTHSDPTLEHIQNDVCQPYSSIYTKMIKDIQLQDR